MASRLFSKVGQNFKFNSISRHTSNKPTVNNSDQYSSDALRQAALNQASPKAPRQSWELAQIEYFRQRTNRTIIRFAVGTFIIAIVYPVGSLIASNFGSMHFLDM